MNYLSAQADVEKAKEDYNRLLALQSYKSVTAPFDGVVSKYNIDAGANVVSGGSSTSTSLFEIQQTDKFRASVFVPQNYVRYIYEGQPVEVYTPENPKQKIKGYISQISALPLTREFKSSVSFPSARFLKIPILSLLLLFNARTLYPLL